MNTKELISVQLVINDMDVSAEVPGDLNLMQFLRMKLGLMGTKNGCEKGHCGSCSIIFNGKVRRACLVKMKKAAGARVETIEALSRNGDLHPIQQAFVETNAAQCGFCTPGMIMAAKALLDANPSPTSDETKAFLTANRNLCRCTGYVAIIEAIQLAAKRIATGGDFQVLPIANELNDNPQLKGESIKKVTGACVYADDIVMDDMIYGKILWAAHPHAKIINIDTAEAEVMDGVALVLTSKIYPG